MKTRKSDRLFLEAQRVIPGGVNSPVRAFKSVGRNPLFIDRAKGAYVWDVDGNKFIDFVGSWGPMILGHAQPNIVRAIRAAAARGTSFGAPVELELKVAKLIRALMPSLEMVRMVNSGTEATMSAVRLARAYTGRDKIIKFEGCYHGHADSFLIRAGSGAATLGIPDSPGIPKSIAGDTLTASYNNIDSVQQLIESHRQRIAAIIVEPVAGNMGCIPPHPGFLQGLRDACSRGGIVLIFDEVITGFRVAAGGAQSLYGVEPDMTTLGKIIGGGLPVGAYGGRKEIMQLVAPSGPVYQAGTLSGNPLAMAAGYEMLSYLSRNKSVYGKLERLGRNLEEALREVMKRAGAACQLNRVGSMFTIFFSETPVVDYASAKGSDVRKFSAFFNAMLLRGIYLPPSQFETAFLSTAHSAGNLRRTIDAAFSVLRSLFR